MHRRMNLGVLLDRIGEHEKAIESLERAIRLERKSSTKFYAGILYLASLGSTSKLCTNQSTGMLMLNFMKA